MSAAAAPAPLAKKSRSGIGRYTKLPHWFFEQLPRITSCESEIWIVLWVWRMTAGKKHPNGSRSREWTPLVRAKELAALFFMTIEGAEKSLKKLCWDEHAKGPGRGVLLRRKIGRGYIYRCHIEAWADLEMDPSRSIRRGGFVYCLRNACMPGIVKIGLTTASISKRIKDLSRETGCPTPFELVCYASVDDCAAAEGRLHQALSLSRLPRREFFRVEERAVIDLFREQIGCVAFPEAQRRAA